MQRYREGPLHGDPSDSGRNDSVSEAAPLLRALGPDHGRTGLPLFSMSPEADVLAWDAEAKAFDETPDHGLLDETVRSAWERLLTEKLPAAPARIADLGCGTGTLSVLLADAGHHVDGLDFSPGMVRRAEAKAAGRAHVRVLLGDAYDPPLAPAAYDVVLSRHVLWAMPDPALALSRWTRLLKPQGILLLVEGRWSNNVGLTR